MALATKQIIENSDYTAEIKRVGEQFAAIQKALEKAFKSQDAQAPEDGLREFVSIYDLYLYIESESNPVERLKSLEELERSIGAFKTKYQEFAPKEAVKGIENVQLWAKISRTMIHAKGYSFAADVEEDELRKLQFFHVGLINLLDIAENYLSFFTKTGRELVKAMAEAVINDKELEDDVKKRPIDEITSQAIGIRNAAKAILWEISRYENKTLSYKALYEEAKKALETDEQEELVATLRYWRKDYINELDKLSEN